MPSKLKLLMNSEYKTKFENIKSMLFFDYQGISASDLRDLRNELIEQKINVAIIKNRVFAKAMEKLGTEGLGKRIGSLRRRRR